jgi:hypothetical protein
VPAAGLLGPVLVPQIWWRDVIRRWDRVFADPHHVDVVEGGSGRPAARHPSRRARPADRSLVGYGVGAAQLWAFADLPVEQLIHVALLGGVTGLLGALFAFLYLERLLAPLVFKLGSVRPSAPPVTGCRSARRSSRARSCCSSRPCRSSARFWNVSARILEQEAGSACSCSRVTRRRRGRARRDAGAGWTGIPRAARGLGRAYVVDRGGRVIAGRVGRHRRRGRSVRRRPCWGRRRATWSIAVAQPDRRVRAGARTDRRVVAIVPRYSATTSCAAACAPPAPSS